jgi:hypothetical protein
VVGVWGGGLRSLYIARAQIEVTGRCVEIQTARCATFPDAHVEENWDMQSYCSEVYCARAENQG